MGYTRTDWSEHYNGGRGFRRLGDEEKCLLVEHAPAAEGGRALDVGCGTGEMSVYLTSLGYTVDGADFAEGALERARAEHAGVEGVRWLSLDVERDDLAALAEDGYDLIVLRLCIAFIRDRARVLRRLAARLREGGVLVIITPIVENTPEERRHIALDENELTALTDGFEDVEQFDAEGLAVLVLRGPAGFSTEEKLRPEPQAVFGAAVVVTDTVGRVLLGRSTRGMWELPGGRIETDEAAPAAAVRELNEETGLTARVDDAHVITVLHDDRLDVVGPPAREVSLVAAAGQGRLRRRYRGELRSSLTAHHAPQDPAAIGRPGDERHPPGHAGVAPGSPWGILWRRGWGISPSFTARAATARAKTAEPVPCQLTGKTVSGASVKNCMPWAARKMVLQAICRL